MAIESKQAEQVFRALGDRTRRKVLLILKESPGATVSEVCDAFSDVTLRCHEAPEYPGGGWADTLRKGQHEESLFLETEHLRTTVFDWMKHLK